MELPSSELIMAVAFLSSGLEKIEATINADPLRVSLAVREGFEEAYRGLILLTRKIDQEKNNQEERDAQKAKNAIKLDEIIAELKTKFPDYIYINAITQDCREKHMLPTDSTDYGIFVKGIPEGESGPISRYIFDEIYMKIAETNEPLPAIYTLTGTD
jgi:hypothetical protein